MKHSGSYGRRTKIVCTIGPATGSPDVIEQLIRAGMDVARMNLSHGSEEEHAYYIRMIREMGNKLGKKVSILMDLPGPKYRTGKLKKSRVALKPGADVVLTTQPVEGNATLVSVNLPSLPQDAEIGDTILLDDGAMKLRVLGKEGNEVRCRIIVGGWLTEGRGLVIPGRQASGPFLTDALREHIRFAVSQQPDYLAISFAGVEEDVSAVRDATRGNGADIPIITKIERGRAVTNFNSILAVSDGIMVARGDLGVDIPLERVPLVQKEVIQKCNQAGKPVITATQMLESMVTASSPTRAEVADVANAILDGTDATMLSEETSVGKYPVAAVRTMDRVARETESSLDYSCLLEEKGAWLERVTDELISYSAGHIAQTLRAATIVAFTFTGSTAKRVSKYRPGVPILAITPDDAVCGRLLLYWGIYPFQMSLASSLDGLFADGVRIARELKMAKPGDLIVITGGLPIGVAGSTNLLKVQRVD